MSDKKTKPGAMDDDAKKRAKKNRKQKQKMLQDIFDDNKSGRPQDPDGRG